MISKVVSGEKQELANEGIKLASYIASKSPVAVQGTKNILDIVWGMTVEDNMNCTPLWSTAKWTIAMLQDTDRQRAILSGLRKKTPTFEKL